MFLVTDHLQILSENFKRCSNTNAMLLTVTINWLLRLLWTVTSTR